MHILFEGQVFGRSQGDARCGNTLDGRVVGQVGEENGPVDGACSLEVGNEEIRLFKGNTDGGEHYGEVLPASENLGLPRNLSCQLGVGKSGAGEYGQLLPSDQSVQPVDGGYAGLDEFRRVVPGRRINRQAVDVHPGVGDDFRTAVNGPSQSVKDAAKHIF